MLKANIKNECIKRQFFKWLKEADGAHDSTVDNVEKAVLLYEDFVKHEDFRYFSPDKAVQFKEWLKKRQHRGKALALATYCSYLRYLRKFFSWLCWQPGYKSRITPDMVDYFKVSEKEERMAAQYSPRNFPPVEYVLQLIDSIKIDSEIDQRDQALIAFTLASGMRDTAIATLPVGCFNEATLRIDQNPLQGVLTKFSKHIPSTLFNFNDKLIDIVVDWVKYLRCKGFGSQDPLFPRSKILQGGDNLSFEASAEVEPVFWQGAGRIREIFKVRSKAAGLPYYPPHTFRHLAVDLALKNCRTGDQIKAVSQNFGHEHVGTTMASYANYMPDRLAEVIKTIDFSGRPKATMEEMMAELLQKVGGK